ncbi:MAG: hypothetical protein JXR63_11125 [Spirochaetales bacterium]|nr:hypothetical protein [Spirochaetales bacterium]
MKTKVKIFLCLIFLFAIFPVIAEEEKKEEASETKTEQAQAEETKKKVEPKISFQLSEYIEVHSNGFDFSGTTIGFFQDAFFSRTSAKANVALPFDFYTMNIWVEDDFDFRLNYKEDLSTENDINLRGRNRIYLGMNNNFKFKNTTFGLNLELRLESDMRDLSGTQSKKTAIRFNPNITIGGKYDCGFAWRTATFFSFIFDSTSYGTDTPLSLFDFEAYYNFSYDFMQHVEGSSAKGWIFLDNQLATYIGGVYTDSPAPVYLYDILTTGLNFDISGFQPKIGAAFWFNKHSSFYGSYGGLALGLGYKKDNLSINVDYIGGRAMTEETATGYSANWLSRITTSVKFSF